jgi:hypothetical protein
MDRLHSVRGSTFASAARHTDKLKDFFGDDFYGESGVIN